MCVCVCVCVCVCYAVVYVFVVFKGVEAHDIMQHFQRVIHKIFNYLRFWVCMCLRVACVRELVLVCMCVCVCVFTLVLHV